MRKFLRVGNDIIKAFIKDERGIGVVEIILILVILIGLVVIFRTEITKIVEKIFKALNSDTDGVIKP